MSPLKMYFLLCWSVAAAMGAYAVTLPSDLSQAQQIWSWAGILVLWAIIVCFVLDGED